MTRRAVVVATLLSGAGLGATAAGTWVAARAWTPLEERAVAVTGLDASPVLGATALLLVAAALALTMAGRLAARVTGLVVAASAALAAVATVAVVVDPAGPARSAAQAALGVARVEESSSTALPWLTLVVAVAGVLIGVWTCLVAGSWERGGASRYRRGTDDDGERRRGGAPSAEPDDVAAWDALTRGDDPT